MDGAATFGAIGRTLLLALAVVFTTACAAPSDDDGEDDEGAADNTAASAQALRATGLEYSFENWDHDGAKNDNPVALVFVSNKPNLVDRVYAAVEAEGLTHSGSKMSLAGVGGSRPGVNPTDPWHSQSAGRKGAFGCWGHCTSKTDIHIRTYGPDGHEGTQVYQGSAGIRPYYLIATVHFDVNENTPQADFGYQDTARSLLLAHMIGAKKKWRQLGSVNVRNACNGRVNRTHMCQHDGKALIIDIDG
jgi:hypothetical protein